MTEKLTEMHLLTNNATHIQQVALALVDAGFQVETVWQEDGAYLDVYPPESTDVDVGAQSPQLRIDEEGRP